MSSFNRQQQKAVDLIAAGKNVLITGSGGVGKSYIIRDVCNENTLLVAPTGIAALNIGGMTAHRAFQLPLGFPLPSDEKKIRPATKRMLQHPMLKTIITDEAAMLRADYLDFIDRRLKMVRGNDLPFGGIQMVLVGDFFQLEPIVDDATASMFYKHYPTPFAFSSKAFLNGGFQVCELTQVVRQEDEYQVGLLNRVRTGDYSAVRDIMSIGKEWDRSDTSNINLCAFKWNVKRINEWWYNKVDGKEAVFKASTTGKWSVNDAPAEFNLKLKKGVRVLITYNHPEGKYVNGERGEVVGIHPKVVVRKDNGMEVEIELANWEKYSYSTGNSGVTRKVDASFQQLPLKLGYALTIHSSQGMTLDNVSITAKGAFAHGMVYMALSRARDLKDVCYPKEIGEKDLIVRDEVVEWWKSIGGVL